jgi:hypothetical protein
VSIANASAVVYGGGYFTSNASSQISDITYGYDFYDTLIAGAACSAPYNELQYFPGINTPQSSFYPVPSPFYPSQQSIDSVQIFCATPYSGSVATTMCLCSPNGSCYYMNELQSQQL